MNGAAGRLAAILESIPQRLAAIPDAEAAFQAAPGRWSKQEILGHLIDSASNNHQRIVRTVLAPRVGFPAYEQESWVSAQSYQAVPWLDLVRFWLALNRHLLHLIQTIPESALSHECAVGGKPPVLLSGLVEGYLDHLNHHLGQVLGGSPSTLEAANKLLIRRYIEEIVNTGNLDRLHEFVAPDFRDRNDPPGRNGGIQGCRQHIMDVRTTYPDLHLTIEDQIAEGDQVVTRVTMTGTHRGGWPPGAIATNKPVRMSGVNIDKVRDGLIVEHGGAANELGAFMEIGLIRFGHD